MFRPDAYKKLKCISPEAKFKVSFVSPGPSCFHLLFFGLPSSFSYLFPIQFPEAWCEKNLFRMCFKYSSLFSSFVSGSKCIMSSVEFAKVDLHNHQVHWSAAGSGSSSGRSGTAMICDRSSAADPQPTIEEIPEPAVPNPAVVSRPQEDTTLSTMWENLTPSPSPARHGQDRTYRKPITN